ncbi:hypothetical protein LCGC14_2834550 [marine sediment metagenome]|uniref:Uncharacterized protein n=1 Tax=marine sediment metagenome TaxID=412755 RepID=A0A0F8YZN2_9ZZZZ
MTIYLNPLRMSKEEFLAEYGKEISQSDVAIADLDDHSKNCVVCLVDNGPFRAAGILHGQFDYDEFTSPDDPRPKKFYDVPTEVINAKGGPDRQVS